MEMQRSGMDEPTGSATATTLIEESVRMLDESIRKQQKGLDEQHIHIDESHAILSDLRSRRNAFMPIFSLPPEVLGIIFSFAQTRELDLAGCRTQDPLAWVGLTQVCRRWREIAIESPNLWIDLPVKHPKWVQEMLRRSRDQSLIVDVRIQLPLSYNIEPGLMQAFQCSHRIGELSVHCEDPNFWAALQMTSSSLFKTLPRLERFRLAGPQSLAFPLFISEHILCKTERLHRLEMDACWIEWDSHPLLRCSLTHLRLQSMWPDNIPTGEELIAALKAMPCLQDLQIIDSLPRRRLDGEHSSSRGLEKIHLANLRNLRIHSDYSEIEDFFQCVTFPPTAIAEIMFLDEIEVDYEDCSSAFLRFARSYSDTGPDLIFQSIILRGFSPDWGMQLMLFTDAAEGFDLLNRIDATPHLDMHFHGKNSQVSYVLREVFGSKLTQNIQHAYIADSVSQSSIYATELAATLGKLPQLCSIAATGTAARHFLNAMHRGRGLHITRQIVAETGKDVLYFPALSSIRLHDVTFVNASVLELMQERDTEVSIELLHDFLVRRYHIGGAISKLGLRSCWNVSEKDVKFLREVVADVDWVASG